MDLPRKIGNFYPHKYIAHSFPVFLVTFPPKNSQPPPHPISSIPLHFKTSILPLPHSPAFPLSPPSSFHFRHFHYYPPSDHFPFFPRVFIRRRTQLIILISFVTSWQETIRTRNKPTSTSPISKTDPTPKPTANAETYSAASSS